MLSRFYCRSALLELINQCNSPTLEVTASCSSTSAALLKELDVENLQLLSNELLTVPEPHGCVVSTSLLTSKSQHQCLTSHASSLSDIFYDDISTLKQELHVAIARAANQGEDYILELTNQICLCLQVSIFVSSGVIFDSSLNNFTVFVCFIFHIPFKCIIFIANKLFVIQ